MQSVKKNILDFSMKFNEPRIVLFNVLCSHYLLFVFLF